MAGQGSEFDVNHLLGIFEHGFRSSPKAYPDRDPRLGRTPLEDMGLASQGLDLARSYLPEKLAGTRLGKWLDKNIPKPEAPESLQSKARQALLNTPLGGYSAETIGNRQAHRDASPEVRLNTTMRGVVPDPSGMGVMPVGDNLRAAAAQNLGVIAGDVATDGVRNIWWFLNAPQALTTIATLQAVHRGGSESKPVGWEGSLLKNRASRLATALPAAIGMSFAIGNYGRPAGYSAVVPSADDKTASADPLAEAGARYVLGRTGKLLPYDEFAKERPDVSKGEYEAYKAFLYGNSWPLKATLDGIHGPEVNFMGKSIPLATGVLPAVAAVIGTRYGVGKAAARLRAKGDTLAAAQQAEKSYQNALRDFGKGTPQSNSSYEKWKAIEFKNEMEILKQALLYGGGSMGAAALAGQTLESIRRATKGAVDPETGQLM